MRQLSKVEVARCARARAASDKRQAARDAARLSFRAWASQRGFDVSSRDGFNEYNDPTTLAAWQGWEAALGLDGKGLPPPRPPLPARAPATAAELAAGGPFPIDRGEGGCSRDLLVEALEVLCSRVNDAAFSRARIALARAREGIRLDGSTMALVRSNRGLFELSWFELEAALPARYGATAVVVAAVEAHLLAGLEYERLEGAGAPWSVVRSTGA